MLGVKFEYFKALKKVLMEIIVESLFVDPAFTLRRLIHPIHP